MVDFRVSDGFGSHPKTIGISLEAAGLWTLAGSWCSRYLTDGYLPADAMDGLCKRPKVIQELVNRNLLVVAPGGWQFVDWLQYQRSKAAVEAERERNRERLAKWREKRGV